MRLHFFFGLVLFVTFLDRNLGEVRKSSVDPFLDDEDLDKYYTNVVSLKYHLKQDTFMEFFTKIALLEMPCPLVNCNVTLIDISEAINFKRFTTDVLAEAIGTLNISPNDAHNILALYGVNVTTFHYLFQTFDVTFGEIYNNFVKTLPSPGKTIPDILTILNVSLVDFMTAQAYGNDSARLEVLSKGNFSKANIEAVLKLTNNTVIDFLKFVPLDRASKNLKKIDPTELTFFVKNLGVTSRNFQNFYKYLNVTPINFLTYPPFIKVVTDLYEHLNSEEILGVVVAPTKIVTVKNGKSLDFYKKQNSSLIMKYIYFHVELVENPLVQYVIKNVLDQNLTYDSDKMVLVEIQVPFTGKVAEITKIYNQSTLAMCTYVTKQPYGGIYVEEQRKVLLDAYVIKMKKENGTVFNLGSPLFCNQKLYGVAVNESQTDINFATFSKVLPVAPLPPSGGGNKPGTPGGKPQASGSSKITKTKFLTFFLFLFFGFFLWIRFV